MLAASTRGVNWLLLCFRTLAPTTSCTVSCAVSAVLQPPWQKHSSSTKPHTTPLRLVCCVMSDVSSVVVLYIHRWDDLAITQFTPSSMHVQPQNILERTFAISVVIAGLVGFSYLVGSITGSLTELRKMKDCFLPRFMQ